MLLIRKNLCCKIIYAAGWLHVLGTCMVNWPYIKFKLRSVNPLLRENIWKQNKTATTTKQAQEEKKNVCKLWALLKISKLRKQTHKEFVPLLVLEEQAQVASKRLELITKYRANTLKLLLFSTVSGPTIRQNFDLFSSPHSTNPTNHCERPDPWGGGGGEPLCLPVWLHRSFGSLVQISKEFQILGRARSRKSTHLS